MYPDGRGLTLAGLCRITCCNHKYRSQAPSQGTQLHINAGQMQKLARAAGKCSQFLTSQREHVLTAASRHWSFLPRKKGILRIQPVISYLIDPLSQSRDAYIAAMPPVIPPEGSESRYVSVFKFNFCTFVPPLQYALKAVVLTYMDSYKAQS